MLNSAKQPPYANAEASQLQYKSQCLEPHLTSIANGLDAGLELPLYLKVEFDDTLLIWMDTATRIERGEDGDQRRHVRERSARHVSTAWPGAGRRTAVCCSSSTGRWRELAKRADTPAPPAAPRPERGSGRRDGGRAGAS